MAQTNEFELTNFDFDFIKSNRSKKQAEFVNIAAHEMKVPVQTILTVSEMLKKDPVSGTKYAQSIIRNARRLQTISKNLLDLTRIENNSLKLSKEVVDLTDLICKTIDDVAPSFAKGNISINMLRPDVPVFIEADKDQITQVVSNLLINAIKFTINGTISVYVKKTRKCVYVTVRDDGPGISPSVLPMLFSKFASTSTQGLGLGLFITRNIVEAHGGNIEAKNNLDGKGASFTFTLPA